MTDHRALQRTLFRMEFDPEFADRVFDRDDAALASTGLGAADRELLLAADPRGVRADPGGRRLSQLVGNVIGEFAGTVDLAVRRLGAVDVARAFPSSPEFHAAVRFDRPLPLAFATFAARRVEGDTVCAALLALERSLAEARRDADAEPELPADSVGLAPSAELVEVPAGTHELAARLAAGAVDDAETLAVGPGTEWLLVTRRAGPRSVRVRDVEVELLTEAVAAVLVAARQGLDPAGVRRLADVRGAAPEELEAFLAGLVAEGVLVRSSPADPVD